MDVKKTKAPLYIFRHSDTVPKSHFEKFFLKFFKISLPFVSHILQQTGVSQSPKGPLSTILRYSLDIAPTLAVPGLLKILW